MRNLHLLLQTFSQARRASGTHQINGLETPHTVILSQISFLFVDSGPDAAIAVTALIAAWLTVKPWREAGYERFLRITFGPSFQNDRLIAAMARLPGAS